METKQTAANILETIQSHLATGKDARVVVATRLRAIAFTPKHASMFRVSGSSLQMQSGKRWLTIAESHGPLVSIRYGRMATTS